MNGKLTNLTNEIIEYYGPKRPDHNDWKDYDNAWYWLRSGKSTDDNIDCDGFYIPADRKLKQLVGPIMDGPLALKIIDGVHITVKQSGAIYEVNRPNMGVFKPSDFCRPSNWPYCVNWFIPNYIYAEVVNICTGCGCIDDTITRPDC
ncbi:hypothetical protein [Peribacillus asahii]|uniref:hypothetical protein n=1 Tax=Peribacillus asahii TaxID=228899 RepID=UPI002079DAC0|nr:hypothetical protein [Peribacillus asahii]USK83591.1 hypothetical protein LIT35_14130 [Peribacillus asahii]